VVVLELDERDAARREHSSGSAQHTEVVALGVDLHEVDALDAVLLAIGVDGLLAHFDHTRRLAAERRKRVHAIRLGKDAEGRGPAGIR
jgi:hypothetical protein